MSKYNVFLLFGSDEFRLSEKIKELKTMVPPEMRNYCCFSYDGNEVSNTNIVDELSTPGFGFPKVFIIKNGQQIKSPKLVETMIHACADSNFLLIERTEPKIPDYLQKLSGTLKNIQIEIFTTPTTTELSKRISNWFQNKNKSISKEAIQLILERLGTQERNLLGELEKIDLFYNSQSDEIDLKHISDLISIEDEINIFDVSDAFFSKNTKKAYTALIRFYNSSGELLQLQAILASELYKTIAYKMAIQNGLSEQLAAKEVGAFGYQANKIADRAKEFKFSELDQILNAIIDLEKTIKQEYIVSDTFGAKKISLPAKWCLEKLIFSIAVG